MDQQYVSWNAAYYQCQELFPSMNQLFSTRVYDLTSGVYFVDAKVYIQKKLLSVLLAHSAIIKIVCSQHNDLFESE